MGNRLKLSSFVKMFAGVRKYFTTGAISFVLFILTSLWNLPSTIQTFSWWSMRTHEVIQWVFFLGCPVLIVVGFVKLWWDKKKTAEPDKPVGDDPDLSMSDAIAYIRETKEAWKNTPPEIIQQAITDLAFKEKISVWGQPGEFLNFQKNFEDSMIGSPEAPIKVPFHFFYDVAGGLYEDRGFMLSRFREYPESDKVTSYKRIYNVTVNRGQIDAVFSGRKPTPAPPTV